MNTRRIFTILSAILLSVIAAGSIVAAANVNPDSTVREHIDRCPELRLHPGQVELTVSSPEPESFAIYSITGQLIKSLTISGSELVDLPQGCYIVKCSKWSKTIIIR